MADGSDNPIESLIELFVYAPIGLLYEHQEVLPQLVKRGRSQVQLARVLGQMAVKSPDGPAGQVGDMASQVAQLPVEALANVAAQMITEVGSMIGLAPPKPNDSTDDQSGTTGQPDIDPEPDADATDPADDESPATGEPSAAADPKPVSEDNLDRLPIAGYDDLNARQIIDLLADLTASQLARVRNYESINRSRKTVLAKIDRLQADDS